MKRSSGLATVATFGFAAAAPALVVWNLNDLGGAGISTPARQSFEVATRYWSSILEPPSNVKDDVTINLDIGFKPAKDPKELGGTESQTTEIPVAKIYDVLRNGGKDPIDETAVSHLPALRNGGLAFGTHGYSQPGKVDVDTTTSLFDDDGSKNNTVFELSNTLTKSLGFQTEYPTVADAQVVFNSAFSFDFDPSDGISSGSYDFLAIVTHELGSITSVIFAMVRSETLCGSRCCGVIDTTPLVLRT
ncbi:MAG: NF038122 family metalloprotease [Rhodobacterales bacterium]|nr:NF038122 family metalloprotease [Rhodobacterales bacterium]